MDVQIIAKWKAGGVTVPIDRGEKRFSMNASDSDTPEEILDIARQRAVLMVKREGFESALVEIERVDFT